MKVTEYWDNNYSVTTQTLAQSLNRASATAATFGVSLEELIGNTVAIGETTRESGSIIGNSLRSIYARITNNENAISALRSLGISVTDSAGEARSATDIIAELAGRWDGLSEAQQRNTSIGIAGIYQLNRFNALLLNYDQSINATTTALNANGSAQREQDRYNESLQARINRLSIAWSEFANTVGQSVLSDGIVAATSSLEGLVGVVNTVSGSIGILPALFGSIGAAIYLLSPGFRAFTASVATSVVSLGSLTISSQAATSAVFALGTALRTVGSFLGVTAVITAVGFAVSALTKNYAENKREEEAFQDRQKKNVAALSENRDEVNSLITELQELRTANGQLLRAEDADLQQRFLDIQNRLAEVYPSLVEYIDESGNAHIRSNAGIEETIANTKELIKAQNDLFIAQARAGFDDSIEQIERQRTAISLLQYEIEKNQNRAENGRFLLGNLFSESDAEAVEEGRLKVAELQLEVSESSQKIRSDLLRLSELFSGIEINPALTASVRELFQNLNLQESFDAQGLRNFSEALGTLEGQLTAALNAGDEATFELLRNQFQVLISPIKSVNNEVSNLLPSYEELSQAAARLTGAKGMLTAENQSEEGSYTDLDLAISNLLESTSELASAEEQLAGVSGDRVEATNELIFLYEALTAQLGDYTDAQIEAIIASGNISKADQSVVDAYRQRQSAIAQLVALYPTLASQINGQTTLTRENVKSIETENRANEVLLESYKNLRNGALNSEQQRTLAAAQNTRDRIRFLESEIRALETAQRALAAYSRAQSAIQATGLGGGGILGRAIQTAVATTQARIPTSLASYTSELQSLRSGLGSSISSLASANKAIGSSSKGSSAAQKQSNEVTRTAIYLADQNTEALERLNLELQKQQNYQKNYNEGSSQYLSSLQKTRSLENQRLSILQAQEKSLKNQIATGRLVQYGVVDTTPGGNSQSASVTNANRQQELARARSELLKIQGEISNQQNNLIELERRIVDATIARFDNERTRRDSLLDFENQKIQELDQSSKRYGATLDLVNKYLRQKQALNRDEITALNTSIATGRFYGQNLKDLQDRIRTLTTDITKYNLEIQANNLLLVQNAGNIVNQRRAENASELERLTAIQQQYNEDSNDFIAIQKQRIALQQNETRLIKEQREALQRALASSELNSDGIREIEDSLRSLSVAYYNSINAERALADEIAKAQTSRLNDIADDLIAAYKKGIDERRSDFNRQIDLESKREEELNRQRLNQIQQQRNAFRDFVNERLQLLDREEAQRSFDENIDDLLQQQSSLQDRINLLSLDNSSGAQKERRDLQKQYDDLQKQINDARRDRDLELQRQTLNDLAEQNDKELDLEEERENESYNLVKNRIDAEREYYNQYYEDLANDERKFAEIREQILNQNFSNITSLLSGYITDLESTLPELQNDLEGTMEAVGTAIRQNVIDNLREALSLINQVVTASNTTSSISSSNGASLLTSNQGGTGSLSQGDLQVLLAKYLNENVSKRAATNGQRQSLVNLGNQLAANGRSQGSQIAANRNLDSYISNLDASSLNQLAQYITQQAPSLLSDPALRDYLLEYANRLFASSASLNTGGRIPKSASGGVDGLGGRGVIVHPGEIVNNPVDSENLLEASNILDRLLPTIRTARLDDVSSVTNPAAYGDIVFNVENLNGTREEARSFVDEIDRIRKNRFGGN